MKTGCDVSNWQHPDNKTIDYELAVAKGIDFAIVQYRDEEANENPFYSADIAGFKKAGAGVGSYIFVRPELALAGQVDDAKRIAEFGPVWADLEVTGGLGATALREWWEKFHDSAPHVGLCTYPAFIAQYGPFVPGSPLWVDHFGAKAVGVKDTVIWGMSDSSTVPGIPAVVDLDGYLGTAASFDLLFPKSLAETDPEKVPAATPAKTVKAPGPMVAAAGTPTGDGYWIATAGGDVYPFGDAAYHGSPTDLTNDVVSIVGTPSGRGYRLITSNGTCHDYGDARLEHREAS